MTAAMLRTWESSAAHKGDLALQLSPWRNHLNPPGISQVEQDQGPRRSQPKPMSPLLPQEATRSPSTEAHLPAATMSRHSKTDTRSKSCDGTAVTPVQECRPERLCPMGTSCPHTWRAAQTTGRDRRLQGSAIKRWRLTLNASHSRVMTGISLSVETTSNQSLIQMRDWRSIPKTYR